MQFAVNILAARRRRLRSWRIPVPERAYWRLFWNEQAGASVMTDTGHTALTPDRVVMVAPRTSFRVAIRNPVHHFHLHFQLERPFDLAVPGVYDFGVGSRLRKDLVDALSALKRGRRRQALLCARIINEACLALPDATWREQELDARLVRILAAMKEHRGRPLSNANLASLADMSPTAFVRLFSQRFGISPQAHCLDLRIERASLMLEYEDSTIEHIAEACGFCDRNYFSAVFRRKVGVPPATFRRQCRVS